MKSYQPCKAHARNRVVDEYQLIESEPRVGRQEVSLHLPHPLSPVNSPRSQENPWPHLIYNESSVAMLLVCPKQ